jgi:hypothetical protein
MALAAQVRGPQPQRVVANASGLVLTRIVARGANYDTTFAQRQLDRPPNDYSDGMGQTVRKLMAILAG